MTNFKRSGTVAALLMASAIPAFAQEAAIQPIEIPADVVVPEDSILLQFTDMEGFYVVSFDDAAEICGIGDAEFEEIAEDPATAVIYCEELSDATVRQTFLDEGTIVPLDRADDADDDDDDGDSTDDAEETAEDEANDEDGDGIFDEDDNDQEEEGLDGADDSADSMDGDDSMEGDDDMEGDDSMDDTDAEVDDGASTGDN